ncbi:MAG: ABC transporter substrate-binding protein [Bacteroidota bacterium]
MRQRSKLVIRLALAACLVATLLQVGVVTAATKSKLPPYEIVWYYLGPGVQRDNALIEAEVNKYLKDKINATVKLNCLDWGSYEQKMRAMIAAGEPFDICFTASWWNNYVQYSLNGAFLPLNDLLTKYAPKTKKILGKDFLAASQINGKNYGIPCNKEKGRDVGFVYNKTLADKYHFDMSKVKSYADIEPMLKTIKENEPAEIVPLENYCPPTQFISWNVSNIEEVGTLLPDGKYYIQYATPEFKAAYALARKFYLAGYFKKDAATAKDKEVEVKQGKFFAYGMNLKPGYAAETNSNNKAYGFETAQVSCTKVYMTNTETMGSLQAISRTSKNPERAMMFLELVNSDRYLNNLINYGIEGKHYTKVSENVIRKIPESGYNPAMNWMFGNQMLNYLRETESPTKWKDFEAYNKKAIPAPDLGFIFDPVNVKAEIAACDNVIKQYHPVLRCGAVDPEQILPEFISKLKAAGAEKVVAEKQRQYDAWKKANKK